MTTPTYHEHHLARVEELSITLRWLAQHPRQCQHCIDACIADLGNVPYVETEPVPKDGHWDWMCPECRAALDEELEKNLNALHDTVRQVIDAGTRKVCRRAAMYHACRLAFIMGEEGADWYKIVHVLRRGLKLREKKGCEDRRTDRQLVDCCQHESAQELLTQLEVASGERFYFCDNNYPGVIYLGTQEQFNYLYDHHGGFPCLWKHEVTAPVGGKQDVPCNIEGRSVIEQWDVLDASVFCR